MPAMQTALKEKLKKSKRTAADLARTANIDYRRLAGFMNGYWNLNSSEERKIQIITDEWLSEVSK
jgi:hypothetical protein